MTDTPSKEIDNKVPNAYSLDTTVDMDDVPWNQSCTSHTPGTHNSFNIRQNLLAAPFAQPGELFRAITPPATHT